MTAMSRVAKLAIIFSAIGVAVGIGVTIAIVYNQTVVAIFQRIAGQDGDSNQFDKEEPLGYLSYYKAILAVGEEDIMLMPSLEKRHFRLNGNLAMVLH